MGFEVVAIRLIKFFSWIIIGYVLRAGTVLGVMMGMVRHPIPVTNTGHSVFSTPHGSLRLNNVLIAPSIVKNLIYVRQFVRDNNCTIEFDAFGFFVKDFTTCRVLLRCDSTWHLYPVTSPSSIPQAYLVSQYTWHQRLGHPGSKVLRRLISSSFISCNKEKPSVLGHACQLGKHVRLPFQIIRSLHHEFAMTDLGSLNYFLDIFVTHDSSWLFLSQKKYAIEILDRAHMDNCNPSRTPIDTESKLGSDGDPVSDLTLYRSLAGSLQYLTFTRPDISYVVQQVCLYMHDPREPYFLALKRILRYVRGTLDYGLQLFSSFTTDLVAYSDADWAGFPTTHRSTLGGYRGVANVVSETCWLRNLLRDSHAPLSSATLVYCDNVSAVYLSCNLVQYQSTKHVEIDIHFVHDLVAASQVRVLHVPSRYQFANIFTKGLPSALFEEFRSSLSVGCPPTLTSRESFVGVLFNVVPSSQIISRLSASNSGSMLDCGFLFRLSDDLRDNCVFWRSSKSSGSSSERGYLNWKDHGEVHEAAPLGNRREDEGIYPHDMHGLLDDLFLTLPMEGNNADTSKGKENTSLNTKSVKNDGTKLNDLLKDVKQKVYASAKYNFPGYANLSGWSTKGEYACLVCAYDKTSNWLDHGRKWCCMGHRRWLEHDHCWRRDIRSFDGNEDLRHAPVPHFEDDVLNEIENIDLNNKNDFRGPWKKKSIFFELPYWKSLLLPHNLDIERLEELSDPRVTQEIKWLARGPNNFVRRYSGYFVKGYRFHTKNHENSLKSQNSGVVVTVLDSSNTQEVLSYYGSLKEVVKLNYSGKIRVVLFKCDWVDVNKGCKQDKFGITLVNFSHLTHSGFDIHDDPFVFASQVDKVFYAKDPQLEGWLVVRHVKFKDAFNMGCNSDQNSLYSIPDTCEVPSLHRNEVDGDDEIDNISSGASDEAIDPSVDKSVLQGAKKRVRGPTKKKEIWNLASDEKVLVTFNELCQPIGDEGNELTNFLRTLVRMPQHIGIHYPEWRKVPKEKKDDLWSIVKFRTLVESWFTEEKQVESDRKKINRLKSIEPHVTGTKSFVRLKDEEADIKAIGNSSSIDQETTNNSDWTNDDLSKVKGPERRGSAQVKYLQQGFMMFAAAVQEQVPNLNLSSVMNFMNMEADGLSSIHDNMIDKNLSSASGTSHHQNSHFSVHDNHPNKSDGSHHHTSVLPVRESTIQKSALKKSGGSRRHTLGDKSGVHDIPINISDVNHHHTSGNKSAVCDTLNKSGTSYT
nr:ribonuclease H-like domain-containing protein [Tanacetum cinerariifolium]